MVFLFHFVEKNLEQVRVECNNIREARRELERNLDALFYSNENAENYSLFDSIELHRKEIAWFHFSGHAGLDALAYENNDAHTNGIAQGLAMCPNLKVVFLNGCSTVGQVEAIHEMGIPVVIATSAPVNDEHAMQFSSDFYRAFLGGNFSIKNAFKIAKAQLESHAGADKYNISIGHTIREPNITVNDNPWGLFCREGDEEHLDWNISELLKPKEHLLNTKLTINLVQAIVSRNPMLEKSFFHETRGQKNWRTNARCINNLQKWIHTHYIGIFGDEIRQLFCIGNLQNDERDSRSYLKTGFELVNKTLDIFNYVLISDILKNHKNISSEAFADSFINDFWHFGLPDCIEQKWSLSKQLISIYQQNDLLQLPIDEIKNFDQTTLDLITSVCEKITRIEYALYVGLDNIDDKCYKLEDLLTTFLIQFSFFMNYRIASIKEVQYWSPNQFIIHYSEVGENQQAKVIKSQMPLDPYSVVFYKSGSFENSLNLSPFVIDKKSLFFESRIEISLFQNNYDENLIYKARPYEETVINDDHHILMEIGIQGLITKDSRGTQFLEKNLVEKYNKAKHFFTSKDLSHSIQLK